MKSALSIIAKPQKNYLRNSSRLINKFASISRVHFVNVLQNNSKYTSRSFSSESAAFQTGEKLLYKPKDLVEFIDWGELSTGIVSEVQGNKVLINKINIKFPNERKPLWKSADDVIFCHPNPSNSTIPPPDPNLSWSLVSKDIYNIGNFTEEADIFADKIPYKELNKFWSERQGKTFSINEAFSAFCVPPTSNLPLSLQKYGIIRLFLFNPAYFQYKNQIHNQLYFYAREEKDMKEMQKLEDLLESKTECEYFLKWARTKLLPNNDKIVEILAKSKDFGPIFQDEKKKNIVENWDIKRITPFLEILKTYTLIDSNKELYDTQVNRKILKPLLIKGRANGVHQFLVKMNAIAHDDNIHKMKALRDTELLDDHPVHILKIAASPHIIVGDVEDIGRVDMGALPVYTIDDDSTTEVDDGISIERENGGKQWIHIHIADPTRLFSPESELDLYVRDKASTVYMPELSSPMFPKQLAEGPMSIVRTAPKNYVLTFSAQLSKSGELLEYRISRAIIRNVVRLNYDQVNSILDDAMKVPTNQLQDLKDLHEIAQSRIEYRKASGAQVAFLPKPELKIKDGKINFSLKVTKNSDNLVAEMMILAGEIAAKYAMKYKIPVPFRHQNPPKVEPLEISHPILEAWNVIKSSETAQASIEPKRHAGMGLMAYSRATSPIRRYTDIITHFQIKNHLAGGALPFTAEKLRQILPFISAKEKEISNLQANSNRFWLYKYLELQGDINYEAVVLGNKKTAAIFGTFSAYATEAFIPTVGLKITIPTDEPLPVGSTVNVQLKESGAFHSSFVYIPPSIKVDI